MELKSLGSKIAQIIGKFKYVILILVIGIALMLIPGTDKEEKKQSLENVQHASDTVSVSQQLEEILSKVAGAGETKVMLTVDQGEKTHYQTDEDIDQTENTTDTRTQTVTVTDANRNQTGLIRQINPPTYLGAIVLCQGADSASVRLAIVDAVSKVTGLGANQISVLKMK